MVRSSWIQASVHHSSRLQISCIRSFSIVETSELEENSELGEIVQRVLDGQLKGSELHSSVLLLHIAQVTSEKEQQLAQLVERVHEVRQRLQYLFMRISSLHKHLKCLCIEHLLHTCFSRTLHSLHLALVLQRLALDIFLCHLRRNVLHFGVADVGRFPHVALNHLRGRLEQSVRS